ncbi:MAG: choice-of-anchor Q domain-containing protein [Dokdonella sp.]
MSQRSYACLAMVVSALGCVPSANAASTFIWPSGSCTTTLQACIDAAAPGDTVLIGYSGGGSTTVVNENILITKSLTLAAVATIDAVFGNGHFITVNSPPSGAMNVTLQRLTLRHGHVAVNHNSDTNSTYTLSQLLLEETDVFNGACVVDFADLGAGSPQFIFSENRLALQQSGGGSFPPNGVCARGLGGPWQVSFFRNHVRSDNGSLGRAMTIGGTSSGTVTLDGNQILGNGFISGITFAQNTGSAANTLYIQNNSVVGQRSPASSTESGIGVVLTNTTLHLVNNSSVNNSNGIFISRVGADSSSGRVANNLIAYNQYEGVDIASDLASIVNNDYNLVYANGVNGFTPGANTVTSNPALVSLWNPRLTAASPARNAGNNADAPVFFLGPTYDADGELRFVGTVDIGAYELNGDYAVVQRATAANTSGTTTLIDALAGLLSTNENLLSTPFHEAAAAGTEMAANLGVLETALSPSNWATFREDSGSLSTGRNFSVLAPFDGRTHYVHATTLGNVVGQFTRLDNVELNNHAAAIAFVEHNYNPGGGAGAYHDHRVGLYYEAGLWYIENQDLADMATFATFNVVIAPLGSPNAFTVAVNGVGFTSVRLNHPLLDGNNCAAPLVTRNAGTSVATNDVAFSLQYIAGSLGAPGHWYITAEGSGTPSFFNGAEFNVMVQGAQADACRDDRIFTDGFEA